MPMLKRKRSESELSFSSQQSSPPRPGDTYFPFETTGVNLFPTSRSSTPSHLDSRTMKRFRDSRPSEEEIRQHTLDLLYSAQRTSAPPDSQPPATPQLQPRPSAAALAAAPVTSRQTSLHSFWNLPGQRHVSTASAPLPHDSFPLVRPSSATSCEDCGRSLHSDDGAAMDIDKEGACGAEGSSACSACGKSVCFSCSVSNLGAHRECLACAGRNGEAGRSRWHSPAGIRFG